LPSEVIKELAVQDGDEFLVNVQDGILCLRPEVTVPRDEAYLFTSHWQQALQEGERELADGDYAEFNSVDDLIADLNQNWLSTYKIPYKFRIY